MTEIQYLKIQQTLMGDGSIRLMQNLLWLDVANKHKTLQQKLFISEKILKRNILKRGVMKDSATTIFNGIGKIEHGASKSNAEQESRLLMLSEKARGDANPMLLIDEDDVMAGHAASVGRVDPVQLYYINEPWCF